MNAEPDYFVRLAAAFVRGRLTQESASKVDHALFFCNLSALSEEQMQALIRLGKTHSQRLHRFKRTMDLPRVRMTLGILKGLQPQSLLDIGSGRGAFLWPLLDTFPELPVTCVDLLEYRVEDIESVRRGGVSNVNAIRMEATDLTFPNDTFDVVTMLEVLEHIPDTDRALRESCRVARKSVILSVPSKPDDNPEHIHLFDPKTLTDRLRAAGIERINISHVPNHILVVASKP